MQTVMITGCSSGFGLDTAILFLERGWRVVATMRTPRPELLPQSEHLTLLALDIGDADSIRAAVAAAGPVDVLVNNAGIGLLAAFEGTSAASMRAVFDTNVLGTIAMTQALLPQMRERGAGAIVNVSSAVTLQPLPLLSVYSASKAAVNAFTESLALEVRQFGIRTHLVLPGRAPATRFGENARARMDDAFPAPYAGFAQQVFARMQDKTAPVTHSPDVTEAIWRAATDPGAPLRIPAGADAVAMAMAGAA